MRNADSWKRAKAIFDVAVVCRLEARSALVRDRCGRDHALAADVESLLEADIASGPVFDRPVLPPCALRSLKRSSTFSDRAHIAMTVGSQFGPYEITGFLGAGSMGEVYRAPRLGPRARRGDQDLPAQWTADSEHRSRFEREARLLAALNHPNIGAIYGIEDRPASAVSSWSSSKATP